MNTQASTTSRRHASLHYRPDIDGLRAIAVLSVLAFHLDIASFSGGYAGVDVFFVISGFLITKLIKKEIDETGGFRLPRFYLRRARRLLPALFATLILTALMALLFFQGPLLARFAGSLVSASVSISNIYFWRESGYFDVTNAEKPLLHTWSLGVEEQFYFIWPLFLLLIIKQRHTLVAPAVILGAAALSLWLNDVVVSSTLKDSGEGSGLSAIFYLTPFRVFEFAIGGLVLWLPALRERYKILNEVATITGLSALFYVYITYTNLMIFPSVNALLPAIGAALILWGGAGRIGGVLLANPLAVWFGKISYSLYLVHWPLIIYYKLWRDSSNAIYTLTLADKLILFAVASAGAALMFRFIETPFRYGKKDGKSLSSPAFGLVCSLIALAIITPAAFLWENGGWFSGAGKVEAVKLTQTTLTNDILAAERPMITVDIARDDQPKYIEILRRSFSPEDENKFTWLMINKMNKPFSGDGRKVLLIGDSQGADFVNLLQYHPDFWETDFVSIPISKYCQILFSDTYYDSGDWRGGGTPPRGELEKCQILRREIHEDGRIDEADTIVLAFSWHSETPKYLAEEIAEYKRRGVKNVYVVARKHQVGATLDAPNLTFDEVDKHFFKQLNPASWSRNQQLRAAAVEATFIDLLAVICFDGRCMHLTPDHYPTFYNSGHLTEAGAHYIGQSFKFLAIGDKVLE